MIKATKPNLSPEVEDALQKLSSILKLWPSSEDGDSIAAFDRLRPYLSPRFDRVDLENHVEALGSVHNVEMQKGQQPVVRIEFVDTDDILQRATFSKVANEWKLDELIFRCPGCFGTGINNGICTLCGGKGWGVS